MFQAPFRVYTRSKGSSRRELPLYGPVRTDRLNTLFRVIRSAAGMAAYTSHFLLSGRLGFLSVQIASIISRIVRGFPS
jgi:hypothetical protein